MLFALPFILLSLPCANARAAAPAAPSFARVEAARSGWQAEAPPVSGWTPVRLPDDWSARWPGFDGVVWYRLSWQTDDPRRPLALDLDYLNMAGALYLNGTLLMRDARLVEPLTRSWNRPRYLLLPAALLHAGTNTLMVRVSGLAAYQPGLGNVTLGDPAPLYRRYRLESRLHRDIPVVNLAVTATLGCFFLSIWFMLRRQSAYGWFGLVSLAWLWISLNEIVTSPWPFASTDGWEVAYSVMLLFYTASFMMFILRFCERRAPRLERTVWAMAALGALAMLAAPHDALKTVRALVAIVPGVVFLATSAAFVLFAWRRGGRTDHRILSFCTALYLFTCMHDLLTFLGVLPGNTYYASYTAQVQMLAMGLVLAWNFAANQRRIEQFNDELSGKVAAAREELAQTLRHRHELEVVNARLSERLSLAHDLHDGLGGTLVSSIATLEHAPERLPPERFLGVLKELRDDLRIIIDTAWRQQNGQHALDETIGPLRHRLTRQLENQHIACRWDVAGAAACCLPAAHAVDVMRVLQEGLTNVLKHSRASRVDIELACTPDALNVRIADDGVGFDVAAGPSEGAGLRSMRARMARLGGSLSVQSGPGATVLIAHIPLV